MIRTFLLLLTLTCTQIVSAQQWESTLTGIVYKNDEPAIFVQIWILENSDTINYLETTETGRFSLTNQFCAENNYSLVIKNECPQQIFPVYIANQSTQNISNYLFDTLTVYKCCNLKLKAWVYKINSVELVESIDLKEIKRLLHEYPNLQLKFFQCASPFDRKRIIKKRMKLFRELLRSSDIDCTRILFPQHPETPDSYVSDSTYFNGLPHISGIVVSL